MNKRYLRQKHTIPYNKVKDLDILVVGAGAIGRQVCRQISLLGVNSITIIDHDNIEEHNCIPQMWPLKTIGKPKVEALGEELSELCDHTKIICVHDRWVPIHADKKFDAVFPCVDNIEVRKNLFNFYTDKTNAFMDIRIGGDQLMNINVIGNMEEKQWYNYTLFDKSEAAGSPCAQPMTNYIASIASGMSVSSFAKHIAGRGFAPFKLLEYSTLTDSLKSFSDTDKIKEYFSDV